jgi:serine/threonine-protein kinase HipA
VSRQGKVFYNDKFAGILSETEEGYSFVYDTQYLEDDQNYSISQTLPKEVKKFLSKSMFAFFDGLIPEGWLLNIAVENWKLNSKDRMGLLLTTCKDCIGAVSIIPIEEKHE